jgi:phosphatidylinositol alpha-1,6-mannosyltransferase
MMARLLDKKQSFWIASALSSGVKNKMALAPKQGSGSAFLDGGLVLVTHEYAPFRGGVATYVKELATALKTRSPQTPVHVLTLGEDDPNDKLSTFSIERIGGDVNLQPASRLRLIHALHRRRHRHETWILCSYGALFAMMVLHTVLPGRHPEYLILLHGSELLKLERNLLLERLSRKTFALALGVAATSHHVCERMLNSRTGRFIRHGFVLPCGPPAWLAQALPRGGNPLPEKKDGGRVLILTLARLHPRKGQLDTALALARLPASLKKQVHWILAGTGEAGYLDAILKVCRDGEVSVEAKGEISPENMAAIYAACDLYVMSSRSLPDSLEGFGLTYLEAAWFGKPCIGYRTGGVSEAVRHEETGLLVEEGDVEKLGEALATMAGDPAMRRRMGLAAARHARSFNWNDTADILIAFRERMRHGR